MNQEGNLNGGSHTGPQSLKAFTAGKNNNTNGK